MAAVSAPREPSVSDLETLSVSARPTATERTVTNGAGQEQRPALGLDDLHQVRAGRRPRAGQEEHQAQFAGQVLGRAAGTYKRRLPIRPKCPTSRLTRKAPPAMPSLTSTPFASRKGISPTPMPSTRPSR